MKPRPIRIVGDVAYVPLTKGFEAIIDASDAEFVGKNNWSVRVMPTTQYAQRTTRRGGKVKTIPMHRALLGCGGGYDVDHIDGNGLNNRRDNLRVATRAGNKRNSRRPSNNTSGYKGVSWRKRESLWTASICCNGKQMHLGYFSSAEDAHDAYAKAATFYFGAFARTA